MVPGGAARRPGTPRLLRELNDRAALRLLLDGRQVTRSQLADLTGVSKVTVAQMLARLEERGLVAGVGELAGGRGPNATLYSAVPASAYAAGLYVEQGLVITAVADVTGTVIAEVRQDASGAPELGLVRSAVDRVCASAGISVEELSAFVIGSPGVVDPRTGDPLLTINLPEWHEGVRDGLCGALRKPVLIENDVNLAAMAERAVGAAVGVDDFVLLWAGIGVGLGTVIGGRLHRGVSGAAGEIGWLPAPGAPLTHDVRVPAAGGLQWLVGGEAVRRLAAEHGLGEMTADGAVRAAVAAVTGRSATSSLTDGGDSPAPAPGVLADEATAFLDELAYRMAVGATAVCAVLDPGLVVLGGEVGLAGGAELADRVAARVKKMCPVPPRVVATGIDSDPVLRGALLTAVDQARADLLASVGE
ncbi:MAG: ROK family transcriptional regulator [Nocardiopsaceae bacterium]|nr:ROK family transcriptional regulator [Nocardiopsaceae bacterium]